MKIVKLMEWVYRIEDFFSSIEKYQTVMDFIDNLDYKRLKWQWFNYHIVLFSERLNSNVRDNFFRLISKEINIMERLFLKVTGKKYFLNTTWSFMKLIKGDYIDEHTDEHSDLQCVMHFQDVFHKEDNKWGNLVIYTGTNKREHSIDPLENSVIVFPWKLLHAVPNYYWDKDRYSLSFGFTLEWRQERNSEYFRNEVEEHLHVAL